MEKTAYRAIAIVGVGAILPDAPSPVEFWQNIKGGRYSIAEIDKERWDPALYYDPDPHAPEKTYSKIGGWVRSWEWEPHKWGLALPPRVSDAMDLSQKWAVACTAQALHDYGYPARPLNTERTAVILGNAMAGERHYLTALRIYFPEYAEELAAAPSFAALPAATRAAITAELRSGSGRRFPPISEDTMPGELSNCIAGRVANLFNFHGPNYVVDAACASAMAAITAAIEGLVEKDYDVVIAGGIDRNMGAATFVKFCKIGALSATGTRPYADGADGFVMGEGGAIFVLKRLADAEAAGDRIYAVIRGIGGSSDGKGKGITAPNPLGQRLCIERAWNNAGLSPAIATLFEGHGTSTRVGDVVEVGALSEVLTAAGAAPASVALGSVKSNIGHLKAAAGAAGLLKLTLALHEKLLPPSLNCSRPNPNIDFTHSPLRVNTELRDWPTPAGGVRVAGLSAFGFGGTNFHLVLQEHVPGLLPERTQVAVPAAAATLKAPLRGALVVGAASEAELVARLQALQAQLQGGVAPPPAPPAAAELQAAERLVIDYGDAAELADKLHKAHRALSAGSGRGVWRPLRSQGIFRGSGPALKVAFLFTGQGSQYPNMLARLREREPVVAQTFAEADAVMQPLLGRPLSEYLFTSRDPAAEARAEEALRQTAITQPAVLATDCALTRLLAEYGIGPDLVMGHSLGEYSALVAADALSFADALLAVSARGREMTELAVADNGLLAAVFAPLADIERILAEAGDSDVVIANVNSTRQAVIGGGTAAMTRAMAAFGAAGFKVVQLPVSHAFHTRIVAPASAPLRKTLEGLGLRSPRLPVIANVSGEPYPSGPAVTAQMVDLLSRQVASPVQFVKGLHTLYAAGVRLFVEVGPKKALQGFVDDVFAEQADVYSLYTNHPKLLDEVAFNQALCGLYAAGLGAGAATALLPAPAPAAAASGTAAVAVRAAVSAPAPATAAPAGAAASDPPVVITGAALGLPGAAQVFDDDHIGRILGGEQLIDVVPTRLRRAMLDKHITRVVKSETGDPVFAEVDNLDEVIRLAGRGGAFDLASEFGVAAERLPALDIVTRLAIGAGIDALRDAGIPLVLHYKTTSKGTQLPDRYMLPESLRDDTGVIFASAFPGYDSFADELTRYHEDRARRQQLAVLKDLRGRLGDAQARGLGEELDHRIHKLQTEIDKHPYSFDRRFLFRVLAMGHSQFAELLGARGPNTQINAACASSTQAVSLAWDWIRAERCRRVIIIAGDDVTSDHLLEWMGAGFLASGAAATDDIVEDAAIPFDRRRHGMIMGMGAAALVVESAAAARERGLAPICEVLAATTANSAFHGTRLDVEHIGQVMERLVSEAERRGAVSRQQMAAQTVFISHETYTPSRGGSAAAEIHALRRVFGGDAEHVVIANTKGFTGHAMAVGIEDVVAVKALETGIVPPVANFKQSDPELGTLNLSRGGSYPVRYALRLGAGFGSQISMTCLRWVATGDGKRREPEALGYGYRVVDQAAWQGWLSRISGRAAPTLEVSHRTLRVHDAGLAAAPSRPPAAPAVAAPRPVATAAGSGALAAPPVVPKTAPVAAPPAVPAAPAAPPAAPVKSAAPVPPAAPAAAEDDVKERVLALMADKTGYAVDMLDPELDLEADLGIDTVKQAEIFATIRQAYGIPRDDQLKLRDYPTIAKVLGFVRARRTDRPATPVATANTTPAMPATPDRLAAAVAPPAVVQQSAPPAAAGPADAEDDVKERVLALMADKTGYAVDMLDPELDLEADLGIDTVKQAEIFATIRQAYGIPRDDQLKLRDYPTIAKVLGFVRARRTDRPATPAAPPVQPTPPSMAAAASMQRRVPVPVVRPPLQWCKPTGVRLEAGQRVLVALDRGGVGQALTAALRELGVEVLAAEPAELVSQAAQWLAQGPVHGVYWLPALDAEGALAELDLASWRAALTLRVKSLYGLMRALYQHIAPAGTFLISATRLGGQHGYGDSGADNPMGGAVAGFTKAYKRERPAALVKVVDFAADCPPAEIAELLRAEALRDPGAVELGYRGGLRWTVGLVERSAEDGQPALTLSRDSVFVVTGAAGGIVSAIVADLAAACGGTFHLLDKAPAPAADDPDLAQFAADREGLKRTLFERHKAHGERATPAQVERDLAALERAHAAQTALASVRAAGGTAHYHCVDLTDAGAVAQVLAQVERDHGRIDVLMHAAGLEISRTLPDKEPREFELVFDVKSDGLFNLLHAAARLPIAALVVFSSIAGRFGNGGQTDYCAANDLLCKLTLYLQRVRPELRGLAIDWTAWGGIGMASRGSIPKLMELAGIDMLPPAAGVPIVRHELTTGGARGEVVIGQRLGVMTAEWDAQGGLEPTSVPAASGPMLGRVVGMGLFSGLTVEVLLDPKQQAFLHDHQIEGTAVLPGVMGIEAFAEVAALALPGWQVVALDQVQFLAPLKFYRGEPRTLTLSALLRAAGDEVSAECRLTTRRVLPGQAEPQETLHFTGNVRLARAAQAAVTVPPPPPPDHGRTVGWADVYRIYFHGPAYQVLSAAWSAEDRVVGRLAELLPDNHYPASKPLLAAPRLIELCFQTAGVWDLARHGCMALPSRVAHVAVRAAAAPVGQLCAVVRPRPAGAGFDAQVIDESGQVLVELLGYQTTRLEGELAAALLQPLREVFSRS